MIDVDAGDHCAIGIDDVHGVQATAQTDLQNRHIQMSAGHQVQDGQGTELEIGQADITPHRFHRGKRLGKRFGRGRFTVQAAALFKMNQVRGGVDACAVTRLQQHRLQHGTSRPLAIGARHGDDRAVKPQIHAIGHGFDAIQAHVNGHGV